MAKFDEVEDSARDTLMALHEQQRQLAIQIDKIHKERAERDRTAKEAALMLTHVKIVCEECYGTGKYERNKCGQCDGSGYLLAREFKGQRKYSDPIIVYSVDDIDEYSDDDYVDDDNR